MKLYLLPLALLICFTASAQKVALVLSGGGAKGLAHIGVIRALEENNIPIDYIAGTSMGAIVGGLYAAGYSTDQMEALFKSEQFKFWSTGKIQEEYRFFYTKLEETPSWLSFDLEKQENKLKIVLPTNLIPEEQMDFAFMEMFAATNAVCNYDFNNLFVPFFCIATDVYNNKEVQLHSGDMGEAIRASMTFPLYFKPIVIDDKLVFDGGIVNNFPVKNALETFDPDIVIGHTVTNNASKPNEDDVMAQLENLIMRKTDYEVPADKGILIESSFTDVGLLDFDKYDELCDAGYRKTNSVIDSIKARITRRVPYTEVEERREAFNARKPKLEFQNIQVEGLQDPQQRKFFIQSIKHDNNIISIDELRQQYFKLVSSPQIKAIRPVTIFNPETGVFDLHLKVKAGKPLEIKFGGHVSSKPINQGFLSLDYRFSKAKAFTLSANTYFGRFYSSLKLGGRIDFPARRPFYISSYLTFNRWDYYSNNNDFLFEDVLPPVVVSDEGSLRFEAGIPHKLRGKFMLRGSYSDRTEKYYIVPIVLENTQQDRTTFDAYAFSASFEENSFNYKQFAHEGIRSELSASFITGNEKFSAAEMTREAGINNLEDHHAYWELHGKYDKYFRLKPAFTLGVYGEAVYSNKKLFSNYMSSLLTAPAFSPTPFSKTLVLENFRANKFAAAGLKSVVHFTDQLHLRLEGYGFMPVEKIQSDDQARPYLDDFKVNNGAFMGMAGLVYHTGVGPVSLTLNYFENENARWHLAFSFGYVLFNKRAY